MISVELIILVMVITMIVVIVACAAGGFVVTTKIGKLRFWTRARGDWREKRNMYLEGGEGAFLLSLPLPLPQA